MKTERSETPSFTTPQIEAVIRSPLGEVRVWLDEDGDQQTDVRLAFQPGRDAAEDSEAMRRVARCALSVVAGLNGAMGPAGAHLEVAPGPFPLWFNERCVSTPPAEKVETPAGALYADLCYWWRAKGFDPNMLPSMRSLGDFLRGQGIVTRKGSDGRKVRRNLRLRFSPLPEEEWPAVHRGGPGLDDPHPGPGRQDLPPAHGGGVSGEPSPLRPAH